MQRLVWIVVPITIWFVLVIILLALIGPTLNVMDYNIVDTAWSLRSPSFPDYGGIVAYSDLTLVVFGITGLIFSLTNIAYNIYHHTRHIRGFVCGFLLGIPLIISALNLLQVVNSTCYAMQGIVSTLYSQTQLLYCGATTIDNALAMAGIFHTVVWANLVFGISLIVGSFTLILCNVRYFRVKTILV